MIKFILALSILSLVACGGGSSGNGSASNPNPPSPPPPPADIISQFSGTLTYHTGANWSTQTGTNVEYHSLTDTIVFDTVTFGTISIPPSRHISLGGIDYVVNFPSDHSTLIIADVQTSTQGAAWSLTFISSNG